MIDKPSCRVVESNRIAELPLIGKLIKDQGRHIWIGVGAADGDGGPDPLGLLQRRQITQAALDGNAVSRPAKQRAKAKSGGDQVAPSAVALLGADQGLDEFRIEL